MIETIELDYIIALIILLSATFFISLILNIIKMNKDNKIIEKRSRKNMRELLEITSKHFNKEKNDNILKF